MEIIATFLASKLAAYIGGSIGVVILAWILKKIPNDKIKAIVGRFFTG